MSLGPEIFTQCSPSPMCPVSHVTCQVSRVTGEQSHEYKDQIVQRDAGKYIEVENSEKDEKDIKRSKKNARGIRVLRNKTEPC